MLRNFKAIFSYDGTLFFGSQKQPSVRTVQGELEAALSRYLKSDISLTMSSRTDRGVHAFKACANFVSDTKIPSDAIFKYLKKSLPRDISIESICLVDDSFNARMSVLSKSYVYRMKPLKSFTVFDHNYFYPLECELDLSKLAEIIIPIEGKHDFSSFTKKERKDKNRELSIRKVSLSERDGYYEIYVEARSFLRGMVRIIVGSSLQEYFGLVERGYLLEKLNNPSHISGRVVAPPQGLYLYDVKY